jgi:beta-phosphoglucomutase
MELCQTMSDFSEPPRLAVIFDMDGVLVDSYAAHFESWRLLAQQDDRAMTESEFASLFGRTSREIIRSLWGPSLPEEQITRMDEQKESRYREILKQDFPAMDGALGLIDALFQAGFLLAVGSSGPPENLEFCLKGLGREDCFSATVNGLEVRQGKPDPEVFLLAARRLGVAASNCAVIEDAPAGIEAARAAGMTAIALTGTASADKLSNAHLIVNSLGRLTPRFIGDLIRACNRLS